ncbi:BLUF domain-containing protein, partial [Escherichia coli]
VSIANRRNMQSDVTGILLFNGSHFFQLLEGPEEQVKMIYRAICQDPRHEKIVALCHHKLAEILMCLCRIRPVK